MADDQENTDEKCSVTVKEPGGSFSSDMNSVTLDANKDTVTENQNHSAVNLASDVLEKKSKTLEDETEQLKYYGENQSQENILQQNSSAKLENKLEDQSVRCENQSNHNDSKVDQCLTLGAMKKDDSGIDLEKSPSTSIKDCSDLDGTESISESFEDSTMFSLNSDPPVHIEFDTNVNDSSGKQEGITFKEKVNSDIDVANSSVDGPQKEDEVKVTGIIDKKSNDADVDGKSEKINNQSEPSEMDTTSSSLEDPSTSVIQMEEGAAENSSSQNPSGSQKTKVKPRKPKTDSGDYSVKKTRCLRRRRLESDSDDSNDNDENNDNVDESKHSRNLDSDDNSDNEIDNADDNDDVTDDKKSDKSSSSDDEEMEVSDGKFPKQKWRAMYDIREREYGYKVTTPPGHFRQKVQGSHQMVQRLKLQYKMEYHEGCVNALHFNRIGTLLASGSDDLNIVLWNWIKNRPALVYDSGHRSNVFQAKFLPFSGDCHVVSCARDGQVRLADLSLTGVCKGTKKLAQHKGAAHKLALELDSPHIFLSCGEDAVTFEMDLREEKPNKLVTTKENDKKVAIYSIHSNPCNSYEFCVGGRDHYIRLYDKRKIAENVDDGVLKKFCPHHLVDSDLKANVTCACYNYNGSEVLGTYNDEDIYLFSNENSDGAEYLHRYTGHRNNQTVKGVNFYGPQSEFLVSGSDCGHIFLWDKETEKIVQLLEGDEGGVINVLEPHPFAPILATSGLDHDVKVWSPTAENPTALEGLKKVMKQNRRDREEERRAEPEMLDGQMLWFIMNHLRRSRRRRAQEGGPEGGEEDPSSSSDESDSDSENSEGAPDRLQCVPS